MDVTVEESPGGGHTVHLVSRGKGEQIGFCMFTQVSGH